MKFQTAITAKGNVGCSYISQALADQQATEMDNNGCTNCTNCFRCVNCTGCRRCIGCTGCIDCIDCIDCAGCRGSVGCEAVKRRA